LTKAIVFGLLTIVAVLIMLLIVQTKLKFRAEVITKYGVDVPHLAIQAARTINSEAKSSKNKEDSMTIELNPRVLYALRVKWRRDAGSTRIIIESLPPIRGEFSRSDLLRRFDEWQRLVRSVEGSV
jgi:hypothetical protein